jgi:hypothetical protein
MACERDYWYHGASGGYPGGTNCTRTGQGAGNYPTDLSNSSGSQIRPAAASLNGTYNTRLLATEAARLVMAHDSSKPDEPMYMYLAFMAVHAGCTVKGQDKQAPLGTVQLYNRTVLDTYKVAGAMYTELDSGHHPFSHPSTLLLSPLHSSFVPSLTPPHSFSHPSTPLSSLLPLFHPFSHPSISCPPPPPSRHQHCHQRVQGEQ